MSSVIGRDGSGVPGGGPGNGPGGPDAGKDGRELDSIGGKAPSEIGAS